MAKDIGLFWYRRPDHRPNFGDDLSPLVLELATGRGVRHAALGRCEAMGIGSILQIAAKGPARLALGLRRLAGRPVAVWGSGLVKPRTLPRAGFDLLALRGPLTAEALGSVPGVPTGDPGLLARRMAGTGARRHDIGVVAHYVDKDRPELRELAALPGVALIDVEAPPREVIDRINGCRSIVSSSLHGLIVADALQIPCLRVRFSDRIVGGDFKYRDYCLGAGRPEFEAAPRPDPAALHARARSMTEAAPALSEAAVERLCDRLVAAARARFG
ncbi:polysaccharide pyruvyl transferase family protein [Limimaricola pyoseonensis]|uniref:Polysaccharide pyruvyl transferase n=1 Tax=Limimaricola pyoseonensis TaxID=521013 RepID=A0A1G7G6Y1_9RHOB|nr:polysaccharide pyruvyl transferase family protein [Limimaricola pyoseonensis]SDE83863.1 Polysaccharide pyruvyl transferase [Limimaricola pyoseonensis]